MFGALFALLFILLCYLLKRSAAQVKNQRLPGLPLNDNEGRQLVTVGFFHPYCNAGGGGERVLWTAIKALMTKHANIRCIVYTGDIDATPEEIINKASQRFNIRLPTGIHFVFLNKRGWVEANKYPFFTLLGQSLGSLVLGGEALLSFVPDVFIDSMGYAFTLPLFRYFGECRVGCYVHYPTISTDMLEKVTERRESYNNASFISKSVVLSQAKLLYYKLFAYLYGVAGKRADVIMVNSTWTLNHINSLWKADFKTNIVYPPCDVTEFVTIPADAKNTSQTLNIISVAQFRPEKDHPLQIKSFSSFLLSLPEQEKFKFRLMLVGSCRNEGDSNRVEELKTLSDELGIKENVEFHLNVSFTELKRLLSISTVGLHTMWNEHFGIGVVECMAAGTIILAHNSGGPKLDIVTEYNSLPTGYLANSEETYSAKMAEIFELGDKQKLNIIENARESVKRFSDAKFEDNFLHNVDSLLKVYD
ncbi:hypothetical protein LOTGIDRAFT_198678 [Lottia gigantea]|uniref:GDP-Man:Man(3)GlcNAc(2)-PP-Dol alpha-1,2-mannosyltransferase n=1 Tax=Lottia gigantea TaxID=225164 RepID=V4AJR9_LOTGI|nr:hypothetical protein LOTGIDRAFT_198678 [Lottia gigantea]ESP04419.1 hypothetical protein LOTGIDRAFT_198678 [Lottia gigantea]